MNLAIVGLNQIYDKKVDRVSDRLLPCTILLMKNVKIQQINKPYLPLASRSFSTNSALTIVALACSLALISGTFP